jgi:5-methylcytosine-specific restriction protein B
MAKENPFAPLAAIVAAGLEFTPADKDEAIKATLGGLFGTRYHSASRAKNLFRDAYALRDEGVPWAGITASENPPSGAYGGASLAWFPTAEGSLVTFVVGTKGLSPDEGLLTRHGHRRRVEALRGYLARREIVSWAKSDPAAIGSAMPEAARRLFPHCAAVFGRYGEVIYSAAWVPKGEIPTALLVLRAYFDLYGHERGWPVLKESVTESSEFLGELQAHLFPRITASDVNALLRERRFVVLQGPPGTGKTRMAEEVKRAFFASKGRTVQFHPAVTYEDFVVGLSPDPTNSGLRFESKPGWLLQAAADAGGDPYLLLIDEVNRGDLGKVLGEAIYLFESGEIGPDGGREVQLPHAVAGRTSFRMPNNLYVLATMNTADRSIAGMDLAVRRRFAFMTLMPDRTVIAHAIAQQWFERIVDIFVEHASDDMLNLVPGHSYFLVDTDQQLRMRLRYDVLPLLDEYLRQGLLGAATSDLHAVREQIQDFVATD